MTKHYLDVSELEPCEPLEQALGAARDLPQGDYLHVVHRQEPRLLFPLLEKSGFDWHCQRGGPAGFEIFIWQQGDLTANQSAHRHFQA